MRTMVAAAVACLSIITLSHADEARASIKKTISIPAQDLVPALQALSLGQQIHLIYLAEDVRGRRTAGVVGTLTLDEALKRVLSGTGLTYRYIDEQTVSILPVAGPAAPRASGAGDGAQGASETVGPQAQGSSLGVNPDAMSDSGEGNRSLWERFRLAQANPVQAAAAAQSDESPSKGDERPLLRVEEIVVTATRRNQRLQDVPLSISAITAEEIDQRGLVDSADYLRGIPSVAQVDSFKSQAIIIRGMETAISDQNFGAGPTTATYFGETPTTTTAGLQGGSGVDLVLVDIERVEVLRGPQGTSFGNMSLGGAVRVIPVVPDLQSFSGKIVAGYSATSARGGENNSVQGIVNLPLIQDRLAVRAAAYRNDDSGFYSNRAGSNAAFRAGAVTPFGVQAFAQDVDEVGAHRVVGGRLSTLFQATDALNFKLSYVNQKNESDGFMAEDSFALDRGTSAEYEQSVLQVAPEHVVRGESGGISDLDIEILSATAEYDAGWGNLLATYSYTDSNSIYSYPWGAQINIAVPVSFYIDSNLHRENVAELRYVSKFEGPLNFLAGLYYEEVTDGNDQDYKWYGTPTTNIFDPMGVFDPARRHLGTRFDGRDLEQKAAYGEVSWEFLPKLTLTGGVRAYEYDRTSQTEAVGAFYGVNGIHDFARTQVSDTNFQGNLSYKPTEDIMLYAAWAEGFRLGRAQGGLPAICDANGDGISDRTGVPLADTRSFDSDSVDNYEVGAKLALFNRRLQLDADVFRMDWVNIPLRVTGGGGICSFSYFANAGVAQSEGAELQGGWQITDSLRTNFSGSYIDARITEDVVRTGLNIRADSRLPGSPRVNASLGLQYGFKLGRHSAFVRADSIYVGEFYAGVVPSPTTKGGDYVKVDASARVQFDNFYVDVFARNATDETAYVMRLEDLGYRLRPRTVGVQFAYEF